MESFLPFLFSFRFGSFPSFGCYRGGMMIDNMTLQDMLTYRGRQEIPADFDVF